MTTSSDPKRGSDAKLGTFAGVFTPSVLTILGLVLFLRLGYVVGSGGLGRTLLIILIANSISVLTSISLAAIATNLKVKGGGDYYVISRTLGVGYGAALGIVLFFAQAVSIAFYCLGFGEAAAALFAAPSAWLPQGIAAATLALLLLPAWLGSDWATRFQYAIMVALLLGVGSFFVGGAALFDADRVRSGWTASSSLPFWALFAVFFPAVTGFTQGVSMSGDLRDPARSLPRGTFLAVGISAVIYFAAAVVFAGALPGDELATDTSSMRRVATVPWLVDVGAMAATLSSALASFLGAPRILQSLASDRVFPFLDAFAKGHGPSSNPRRGVVLAGGIAGITIAFGKLDLIAPVVSMFFLISYGLLNYATYVEAKANSPSFRPRFKYFDRRVSLVGSAACAGCMVALNPAAGVVALLILFVIYYYVKHRSEVERWADSSRSAHLHRVRGSLLAISQEPDHARDWRPVMLVFSDDSERRQRILRLACWLEGNSGFTTVVRLLVGSGARGRKDRQEAEEQLRADIAELPGSKAFPLAILAPSVRTAIGVLVQSAGLGPVRTNTVLLNWFDRGDALPEDGPPPFLRNLRVALRYDCNVVILEATTEELARIEATPREQRTIHVWYAGGATSRLMLLYAYLMTRHPDWSEASLHLLSYRHDPAREDEEVLGELRSMLDDVRIVAEPELIAPEDPDALVRRSAEASFVFCPFLIRSTDVVGPGEAPLDELLQRLPTTALVLAAQDIELDAEPEAGLMGQIAEAVDAAARLKKEAERAARDVATSREMVEKARVALASAQEKSEDGATFAGLEQALAAAEKQAESARRRAAKMQAKAEDAVREMNETIQGSLGTRASKRSPGNGETAPPGPARDGA